MGLVALRGFYYQYVYSVRLMSLVLNGPYTHIACESGGDFAVWSENPDGTTAELRFVEVKTRRDGCFLADSAQVAGVLRRFEQLAVQVSPRVVPPARLEFVLVYNPVPSHDCERQGCVSVARGLDAVARLKHRLASYRYEVGETTISFERFLHLPYKREELRTELEFLGEDTLRSLWKTAGALEALVQSIVGLVMPLYVGKRANAREHETESDVVDLANILLDHPRTRSVLQTAINQVLSRLRSIEVGPERSVEVLRAHDLARSAIATASRAMPTPEPVVLNFSDSENAERGLTLAYLLEDTSSPLLWRSVSTQILPHPDGITFLRPRDGLTPLRDYLRHGRVSHRTRVQLIVSLVESLAVWSRVGVTIRDFRADDPRYQDLYLVQHGTNDQNPKVILGDLPIFDVPDLSGSLLEPRWIRGDTVARAIRQIYYGTARPGRVKASRLHRAPWNDNVVDEYAGWIASRIVEISDLQGDLAGIFSAELHSAPIFVSDVSDEFVQDLIDAGMTRIVEGLVACRPTRLVGDRITRESLTIFVQGGVYQVRLSSSDGIAWTAEQFVRYMKRRWRSAQQRDIALGVEIGPGMSGGTLVWASKSQLPQASKELFGVEISAYREWLHARIADAQARALDVPLSPVLLREAELAALQRERLDYLGAQRFSFTRMDTYVCKVADGLALGRHLRASGYQPRRWTDLSARAEGTSGAACTGRVQECRIVDGSAVITLEVGDQDTPAESGTLGLFDRGLDRTLSADQVPLRALRAGGYAPQQMEPAQAAMAVLEALIGAEETPLRSSHGLWDGRLRVPTPSAGAFSADVVAQRLSSRFTASDHARWLITGGAGTGKTTVAAHFVTRFLGAIEATRRFPPVRVLVVAATHFAVDNFLRVFRAVNPDRYVAYRYVPSGRLPRLLKEGRVDRDIIAWSVPHYETITRAARTILPRRASPEGLADVRHRLDEALVDVEDLTEDPGTRVVVPEHERWLYRRVGLKTRVQPRERNRIRAELSRRREACDAYRDTRRVERRSVAAGTEDSPYPTFASPLVATTVDGLDDLPDATFDLIVFEEASQLRTLKILKVLTKVARGRLHGDIPGVVFMGDARQLPPFVDAADSAVDAEAGMPGGPSWTPRLTSLRSDLLARESAFEVALRRWPSAVTTLMGQVRMQLGVAQLVNSLFYADQSWELPYDSSGGAVYWIDTSAVDPGSKFESRSRYNVCEIDVISRLVSRLPEVSGRLLVISPYAAQVDRLIDAVGECARTVDGCQGITAETAIVSFVSLRFHPGNDFVAEPRRMNVALSRARNTLYLVGNLAELKRSVSAAGALYPHMRGLVALTQDPRVITVKPAEGDTQS